MTDEDDRTTPIGLFNFADSYWRSAAALKKAKVQATHPDAPICFLYYHSVELYLKAYLRAEGYPVDDLRTRYGHNAIKLCDEAKRHGLHLDEEDVAVLAYMGNTDAVIESRFPRTGFFRRPANEALHRTCKSLHYSVGKALKAKGGPVRL